MRKVRLLKAREEDTNNTNSSFPGWLMTSVGSSFGEKVQRHKAETKRPGKDFEERMPGKD